MVTLKDIAERVGVSITTVSRVLNGKGSISQETKDKVFQVMRELKGKADPRVVNALLRRKLAE